ncbi:MAG: ABC transporter permease [Proteobacteria bacterium]|nr:ABC transporter permease [Pseudomonadota bacterium]MCP4918786.1 ABC transporter permease [Pseudomonadota bacterium]
MIADVGRFALFCGHYARVAVGSPPSLTRVLESTYVIGVKSLPVLLVIAAFIGTNLSIQGYSAFEPLGGQQLVGMFVALAGVRELAPIIAASMVAAKAGTEMASQIAVMRIRQQIDALEVMAVQPHAYLITPRLLGIVFAMPALTALATCAMVSAAYLVATQQLGLNGTTFLEHASTSIAPVDLIWGLIKAMLFGVVICLVSCYQGFRSEPGPEGVGQATNRAVVLSAVTCVLLNYVLSELFYG